MHDHKELSASGPDGKTTALATASQRRLSLAASSFSGPLPPPELFRQYEDICPGAADRILRMSEQEGDHRRQLECKGLDATIKTHARGQKFAFIAVMSIVGMGFALLWVGVPAVGLTMVIGALTTLVGAGIWNKVQEGKQLKLEERHIKALEESNKNRPSGPTGPAGKNGKGNKR